jgi:hypothetical protein
MPKNITLRERTLLPFAVGSCWVDSFFEFLAPLAGARLGVLRHEVQGADVARATIDHFLRVQPDRLSLGLGGSHR